jgi:soluble lytic murein transglycosylase-like protein
MRKRPTHPISPEQRTAHLRAKGHRRAKHVRRSRNAVKGILMGAMIFGAQAKPKAKARGKETIPVAQVSVSIDSFAAVPPYLAYDDIIDEAALEHEINPDLIHAVIETESAFNPLAESPVGAQGLMQLMPALQADLGVKDPFDPRQNIMAGAQYLKQLMNKHHDNVDLALASYNAGPGNVARYKGVPPFKETRNYVKKIKAILAETAAD